MPSVRSFTVLPALPDSLQELDVLARNLFWAWTPQTVELFRRIDPALWASNCSSALTPPCGAPAGTTP